MIYLNGFKYFFNEQVLAFPGNFHLWAPKVRITYCSVKKKGFVLFVITSANILQEESILSASMVYGGSSTCHHDILVGQRLTESVCSSSTKLFYC